MGSHRARLTVAVLLLLAAFGGVGAAMVLVTERVRAATGDVRSTLDVLGIPIVTGVRHAGRIGLHLEWGAPLVVVATLVLSQVLILWSVVRWARSSSARADQRLGGY
jgi:hypothetical protein